MTHHCYYCDTLRGMQALDCMRTINKDLSAMGFTQPVYSVGFSALNYLDYKDIVVKVGRLSEKYFCLSLRVPEMTERLFSIIIGSSLW